MAELGVSVSPLGIARHYGTLLDGLMIDETDRAYVPEIEALGVRCSMAQIVMRTDRDRAALALAVLKFAGTLM